MVQVKTGESGESGESGETGKQVETAEIFALDHRQKCF